MVTASYKWNVMTFGTSVFSVLWETENISDCAKKEFRKKQPVVTYTLEPKNFLIHSTRW